MISPIDLPWYCPFKETENIREKQGDKEVKYEQSGI